MAEQLIVECPGCGRSYPISQEQLGKKATCKSCGEKFVLQAEPDTPAPTVPTIDEPVAADPPPEPEEAKGFFGKLKAAGQKAIETVQESQKQYEGMTTKEKIAHRRGDHLRATDAEAPPPVHWLLVKFCGCSLHTDFGLDPKMDVFAYFSGSCLILRTLKGFSLPKLETTDEVLRIPLLEIEELEVETAERMTLGRIGAGYLLGGPFGAIIGGLWKKEDHFLRVDWGGEHSIVFGKAKVKADALKQKITDAIRQVKEAGGVAAIEAPANDAESSNDGTDIADAIQKLAALHEQGILTDDEFAAKKAELLSRM